MPDPTYPTYSVDNGVFTYTAYKDDGYNTTGWYEITLNLNHRYIREAVSRVVRSVGLDLSAGGALHIRKIQPPWEIEGETQP